ncbi:MAG: restriction endonuclease [Planctomycetes bacterium]|nr:restriction endonuclease [Planctomycetota bacterium]
MKPGEAFERRVADLYLRLGASRVERNFPLAGRVLDVYVVFKIPDRGGKHRIAVEAKDWKDPVGPGIVAEFYSKIAFPLRIAGKIEEGVIVSAKGFTPGARRARETYSVRLIEIEELESSATAERIAASPLFMLIPTPPTPHIAHPYVLQSHFTGRDEQRRMLTSWLEQETASLFLLVGPGGTGKTALSWVWYIWDLLGYHSAVPAELPRHCPLDGFAPEGMFWWSFYGEEASFDFFLDEALYYVSAGSVAPHEIASPKEKVRILTALLRRKRFLLVLDGFERELEGYRHTATVAQAPDSDIKDEFRACSDRYASDFLIRVVSSPILTSRVLLISRHQPRELDDLATNFACLQVSGLDPPEAVMFLKNHGVQGKDAQLKAVCSAYFNDPFALRLVAGHIMNHPDKPGDIRMASGSSVIGKLTNSRRHILQVEYDSLAEEDQQLLQGIAAFCTPLAYEELLVLNRYTSEESFARALARLENRGLLSHDRQRMRFDQHPIVRAFCYAALLRTGRQARRDTERFPVIPDAILAGEIREDMRPLFTIGHIDVARAFESANRLKEEDLTPVIELYSVLVDTGRHDLARALYRDRLADLLYYHFAAYQKCIDLLSALVRSNESMEPLLESPHAQAWTLQVLGNCLMQVGRPGDAAKSYHRASEIARLTYDRKGDAQSSVNLAYQLFSLGKLMDAESAFRKSIALWKQILEPVAEAEAHQEFGRLLVYCGRLEEANLEVENAQHIYADLETPTQESEGVGLTYLALCKLATGEGREAYRVAGQGRSKVQLESNVIWSEWVLGKVLTALESSGRVAEGNADRHLTEALARCQQLRCVEIERYILISCARLQYQRGKLAEALKYAEEAMTVADRGEYRLEQSDAHNIIARVALSREKRQEARQHAEKARGRARCDGPGHWYQAALTEAETILAQLDEEQTGP